MGKLPKYLRWCFLNFSTTRMLSPLPCGNHLKRALSKSHLKPCNGTPLSTQKFLFLPVRHIRPSSASLCPFRFHLTNSSSHFVLGAVQMHWSLRALVLTKMILHSGKIVYLLLCNSSVSSSDSSWSITPAKKTCPLWRTGKDGHCRTFHDVLTLSFHRSFFMPVLVVDTELNCPIIWNFLCSNLFLQLSILLNQKLITLSIRAWSQDEIRPDTLNLCHAYQKQVISIFS